MDREKMVEAVARGIIASTFDEKSVVTSLEVWAEPHFRTLFCEYAQAAIAAYEAELEQAGFRIVPVEPTTQMLVAGRKQTFADMTGAHMGPSAENTYRAMIAAASEKPQSEVAISNDQR